MHECTHELERWLGLGVGDGVRGLERENVGNEQTTNEQGVVSQRRTRGDVSTSPPPPRFRCLPLAQRPPHGNEGREARSSIPVLSLSSIVSRKLLSRFCLLMLPALCFPSFLVCLPFLSSLVCATLGR